MSVEEFTEWVWDFFGDTWEVTGVVEGDTVTFSASPESGAPVRVVVCLGPGGLSAVEEWELEGLVVWQVGEAVEELLSAWEGVVDGTPQRPPVVALRGAVVPFAMDWGEFVEAGSWREDLVEVSRRVAALVVGEHRDFTGESV